MIKIPTLVSTVQALDYSLTMTSDGPPIPTSTSSPPPIPCPCRWRHEPAAGHWHLQRDGRVSMRTSDHPAVPSLLLPLRLPCGPVPPPTPRCRRAFSSRWRSGRRRTCSAPAADLPVVAWEGRTMGTESRVQLVDAPLTPPEVEALKTGIDQRLQINRQMSNYLPESEISRFNRAPANKPFPVLAGVRHRDAIHARPLPTLRRGLQSHPRPGHQPLGFRGVPGRAPPRPRTRSPPP